MNAGKVLRIAGREFASTVLTKGFIIGALVVPAVIAAILPIVIFLISSAKPPADIGEVALIDRSGVVGSAITEMLDPQQIIVNRREQLESMKKAASELLGLDIEALTQEQLGSMSDEQMGSFLEQFGGASTPGHRARSEERCRNPAGSAPRE